MAFRPRGLGKLGSNTWVKLPRNIDGVRKHIHIGENTLIREHSWLCVLADGVLKSGGTPELNIGSDVYIGRYFCGAVASSISIGDDCVLSEHVYIADSFHGYDPKGGNIMRQPLDIRAPVVIGSNTFIGYRAAIMPGVKLGHHCIVAVNSVVTHSFPPYSMLAGSPAKLIKRYSEASGKWELV